MHQHASPSISYSINVKTLASRRIWFLHRFQLDSEEWILICWKLKCSTCKMAVNLIIIEIIQKKFSTKLIFLRTRDFLYFNEYNSLSIYFYLYCCTFHCRFFWNDNSIFFHAISKIFFSIASKFEYIFQKVICK